MNRAARALSVQSVRFMRPNSMGIALRSVSTTSAKLASADGKRVVDPRIKAAQERTRGMQGPLKKQFREDADAAKSIAHSRCVIPGLLQDGADTAPHCFVDRQPMHQ